MKNTLAPEIIYQTETQAQTLVSEFLSVSQTATLLKIPVDQVLLLIFAKMLPAVWRDNAAYVKRTELHGFAMPLPLGSKKTRAFIAA
jgi:hypothetical protein